MAKRITFTAQHEGQTFTRTSDRREYGYTVVAQTSYENALEWARKTNIELHESNFRFHQKVAAGTWAPDWADQAWREKNPIDPETRAKHAAHIEGFATAAEYAAAQRAKAIAAVEEANAAGHYEKWDNLGWCGRLDLAQKLKAGLGSKPHYRNATILIADRG